MNDKVQRINQIKHIINEKGFAVLKSDTDIVGDNKVLKVDSIDNFLICFTDYNGKKDFITTEDLKYYEIEVPEEE